MKILKEIREERDDVFSFYEEKAIQTLSGEVLIDEKVDETTLIELQSKQSELSNQLAVVNEKIRLINEQIL